MFGPGLTGHERDPDLRQDADEDIEDAACLCPLWALHPKCFFPVRGGVGQVR